MTASREASSRTTPVTKDEGGEQLMLMIDWPTSTQVMPYPRQIESLGELSAISVSKPPTDRLF